MTTRSKTPIGADITHPSDTGVVIHTGTTAVRLPAALSDRIGLRRTVTRSLSLPLVMDGATDPTRFAFCCLPRPRACW